eukprot:TRINITY_DN42273_c0_g1_i1.p1 TRINITY_DN42273_c0_g1~~TRINITY_DN42273_c0_g1_i1.p1  ORF type:complete len:245 (-),score=22.38 TRINITY_DN42273_c0_g1_i1:43-777(-)
MAGRGRRGSSSSSVRRGGSRRKADSRDHGRRRRGDSRSRGSSRHSLPFRRSRSQERVRRRSRTRSRSQSRDNKPAAKLGDAAYRIPPPKKRTTDPVAGADITKEMRAASIECEGYLYATIEFTPPTENAPWTTAPPEKYDAFFMKTDITVLKTKSLPKGWELVPTPTEDVVKQQVIKPYPWGTHLLVCEGGNSYWTHAGDNPGAMETIWDYDKYPGRFALKPKHGRVATLHGTFLIRIKDQTTL